MEIRLSAHRHGKTVEDIRHAINHQIATSDVETNIDFAPTGTLFVGPDRAGNLLEVTVIDDPEDGEVIIHAMSLRASYARRLRGGGS